MRMLGEWRAARSALFAAVALKPSDIKLRFELVGLLIELKDFDEARVHLAMLQMQIPRDHRIDATLARIERAETAERNRRTK
jgi:thioredoxin-like negative regulator of GroEL